jgi:thioredoxin domain-containing protein 5
LSASIFSAVDDAAAGKSTYKNSENTIERIARNLSAKMQSLEAFVMAYPFQSVLLLMAVFVAIFWGLTRIVGNDAMTAQQGQNEWREYKGKNGRLD